MSIEVSTQSQKFAADSSFIPMKQNVPVDTMIEYQIVNRCQPSHKEKQQEWAENIPASLSFLYRGTRMGIGITVESRDHAKMSFPMQKERPIQSLMAVLFLFISHERLKAPVLQYILDMSITANKAFPNTPPTKRGYRQNPITIRRNSRWNCLQKLVSLIDLSYLRSSSE